MILKAISVDDEPRAHLVIEHHASKIEQLELVDSFTSPIKAVTFLKENPVDLLFLDINMPDLDGMSLLKTLKEPPAVIFTTAYDEYAVESYDYEAAGYLLKPIEFPKFYKAVMRVLDRRESSSESNVKSTGEPEPSLFLKSGTKMLKMSAEEIRYIEASGNYAELHLMEEKVLVDHTLSELLESFLPSDFIRIHRSYAINRAFLQEYETHQVKVANQMLPVGKTYRKEVKSFLLNR